MKQVLDAIARWIDNRIQISKEAAAAKIERLARYTAAQIERDNKAAERPVWTTISTFVIESTIHGKEIGRIVVQQDQWGNLRKTRLAIND